MKKSTLTENKAEQTPTGGVLVGKRQGQTIIHNKGTLSGYLVGKTHAEGGIKAVNKSTGQALEMQGGEVVITAPAVSDNAKNEFNGKMMTNREVLSAINEKGGGVSFAKGGDIPKNIKRTGASYKYGGKTMTDHEIYKKITGGHLAEGMTLTQIAKKHKVSVKELQSQIDLGMKAESEHTSSKREQMKIVKDHLFENPKYYTLLKKAGLENGGQIKFQNVDDLLLNKVWKKNNLLKFKAKDNRYFYITSSNSSNGFKVNVYDAEILDKSINEGNNTIPEKSLIAKAYFDLDYENNTFSGYSSNQSIEVNEKYRRIGIATAITNFVENITKMKYVPSKLLSEEMQGFVKNRFNYNSGGRVNKISLVRNSKKGDTPARDLNNYNDLLDEQADGAVGGDIGLFAYGGDITYAKGGATNVTVNNWSEIPDEFKNVRLPSKVDWDASPSNEGLNEILKPFLSTEPLRPAMGGINFDENGITATNAHILLTIPSDERDFKGVYKKEKKEKFAVKIDEKYPNYAPIVPKEAETKKVVYIDVPKLLTYFKVASNYSGNREIAFKIDNEIMGVFPDLMINFLSSLIKLGGNTYMNVSFQSAKRALTFTYYPSFSLGKDIIGLMMPYVGQKLESYGTKNEDKKTELNVYYDFDNDEIVNADGSVVDFEAKRVKERVKRTPKTTASKTEEQADKFAGGEINTFRQIEAIVKENDIDMVSTMSWDEGTNTKDFTAINTLTGKVFKLRSYNKSLGVRVEDSDKEISRDFIKKYNEWKSSISSEIEKTSSEFTSGEIDMFKQIDDVVANNDITVVNTSTWNDGEDTKEFDIVNTLTGDVVTLRSFKYSLGIRVEDTAISDDIKLLILGYKEWKSSTPTIIKEPAKEIEKIVVWKLFPVSEDGQHTSDFGLYSAKQLLDYLIDSYSQFPDRDFFEFKIVDQKGKTYDNVVFLRNLLNFTDLVAFINSGKQFTDKYDWLEFNLYDAPQAVVEETKPSKTEKPKRNFELERKYLSQRISDLAKELDLKKPILSNEEVAFYQREINSFILKLRKLNDAEMSLKSIEERVGNVYGLKISSFDKEYPETYMTSINALKSQLTEKEYFNVRTPEFKSFFGDWETAYLNDSYAGVSKVINPITKEPQPVFHGTNVLFVDWKTYETNNAHYFAVKREFSEFFATTWEERTDKAGVDSEILKKLNPNRGNFLLRCFIDIKNPVDFSRFGVEKYPIREYLTFLRVNYNIGDFDFWTNITSHSGFTQDTEVYAWQIIRLWQSFTKYIKVFTMYDGYIFYEYIPTKPYGGLENASLSYCAFDSNQIKFADAYEFNALSNDSRFDLGGIL